MVYNNINLRALSFNSYLHHHISIYTDTTSRGTFLWEKKYLKHFSTNRVIECFNINGSMVNIFGGCIYFGFVLGSELFVSHRKVREQH